MAAKAKPFGHMKINGKTYTFVFDYSRWIYSVYEDMVWMRDYNTKSIKTAKQWLLESLADY